MGKKMTELSYYLDTDRSEFEAEVYEVRNEGHDWVVVSDKTYFYPEGGGQPADRGWLNDIPVIHVRKKEDIVYHVLSADPGRGTIRGKIDMVWRKDFMQQHTGQHIISGALWKIGGYKTLSVHMGVDYTAIEIDAPGITEEELLKTEILANQVIRDNLPIEFIYTDQQEKEPFLLRKPCEKTGMIRLVKIGDFDCVACGGLHFNSTINVGWVKGIWVEKIRGHARIAWKIGDRVFDDYREKSRRLDELKSVLAVGEDMLAAKARELRDENRELKRKWGLMENRAADLIAGGMADQMEIVEETGYRVITVSFNDEEDSLIKKISKNLLDREKTIFCLANSLPSHIQWVIGCSEDIELPFDAFKKELLEIIDGKGGGKNPLWQGRGMKRVTGKDFLDRFRDLVKINSPGHRQGLGAIPGREVV